MSEEKCEHDFQFMGVVYYRGHQLSGTGACEMVYEDKFFCRKCLETKILNKRTVGNDYSPPIPNSIPK